MHRKLLSIWITLILASSLLFGACTPSATSEAVPSTSTPTQEPVPPTPTRTPEPTQEPTQELTPEPIEMVDGSGRTVRLEAPAQRIVSLAPSNTEILYAIGAGPQVVGRDQFSDFPSEAQQVTNIGGGFGELDLETILFLNPDLVLAAGITPPEQVQSLEGLGLTVSVLANPVDLEGMYENLRVVGRLTGHAAEAEALVSDLKARVAAVEAKIATVQERPLVFYELDGTDPNAPWTSGPGTFVDNLMTMAGGRNVGSVLEGEWAQISIEALIEQNPDIIVLGDYTWGGVTPEVVAARAGWDTLAAVQNGRVYTFDDNLVSRPGPRLVAGLEEMARLLHPELFE